MLHIKKRKNHQTLNIETSDATVQTPLENLWGSAPQKKGRACFFFLIN